jgi:hypothetical protein
MSDTTCRRCQSLYRWREHPRVLRTQRDRARCDEAGFRRDGTTVWIPRLWCDCQWRGQLRSVAHDLLPLLLPDPGVEREIRRRAGLERYRRAA